MSNSYSIDIGINEKATIIQPDTITHDSPYNAAQSKMNQYVTSDLIYNHVPNFNGGYLIFIEPGPWIDLLKLDKHLNEKYSNKIDEFIDSAKSFSLKSPKLAYQIEAGAVSVGSDSVNLRHMNQSVFSHESQISSVSITYLEEYNIVEFTHYLWVEFMKDLKKGYIDLPDKYRASDVDVFCPIPYYGRIWAYSYNPVDLRPRSIILYNGIYPSNDNLSDAFGQRGQNNHYMKNISYNVVNFDRSVYSIKKNIHPSQHFDEFYRSSKVFKNFIDTLNNNKIIDY